jgi:hypothetical protein
VLKQTVSSLPGIELTEAEQEQVLKRETERLDKKR